MVIIFIAVAVLLSATGFSKDEDVIILKTGGMYKGKIEFQSSSYVKIRVKGRLITVRMRDIRKIIAKERPEDEYKRRADDAGKGDVKAHYDLALWCLEKGLEKEAEKHIKIVLKEDPDHAGARKAGGFGLYDGEWHPEKELEKMGLVRFESEWIRKEDLNESVRKRRESRLAAIDDKAAKSEDGLDALLSEMGHTFSSMKIRGEMLYKRFRKDRTRIYVVREPLSAPAYLTTMGHEVRAGIEDAALSPVSTIGFMTERSGRKIETEGMDELWTPPEEAGNNLHASLWSLARAAGSELDKEEKDKLRSRADKVPAPFRDGLARLLNSFTHACLLRKKALEEVMVEDLEWIVERNEYGSAEKLLDSLDFAREITFMQNDILLAEAGMVLGRAVLEFAKFAKENELAKGVSQRSVILDVDTPFGKVVVGGTGDNFYDEEVAFLVDLGGNDAYQARLASSRVEPGAGVSLLLDLGGDDEYISKGLDAFGCGYFGVGLLFDMTGSDTYSSVGYSMGSAYVGLGLLYDGSGNDTYQCGTFGQGCGLFGYGMLIDTEGDDRYVLTRAGQGYGGTYGVGLLLDGGGNDEYEAGGGLMGDPLDPESVACDAQGAARGASKKDDTALSISGGWGVLADMGGDDSYKAKNYAQGVAYWSSVGMLLDLWGNDTYEGGLYVQGAGSSLASGLLADFEGDDVYTADGLAQGAAVNFSVGILQDFYGDDQYKASEKCMGYVLGLDCLGALMDLGGNDRYEGSASSLGFAEKFEGQGPDKLTTAGIFLDFEGDDIFRGREQAGNSKKWIMKDNVAAGCDL